MLEMVYSGFVDNTLSADALAPDVVRALAGTTLTV